MGRGGEVRKKTYTQMSAKLKRRRGKKHHTLLYTDLWTLTRVFTSFSFNI